MGNGKKLIPARGFKENELFKEFKDLIEYFILESKKREKQEKKYKSERVFFNGKNWIMLDENYRGKIDEYNQKVFQRSKATATMAKLENLFSCALTFTLDSLYHPFRLVNGNHKIYDIYDKNPKYKYKGKMRKGFIEGYQKLQEVWRTLYLILQASNKRMYFTLVVEPHKSLVPHMHIILYIERIDLIENEIKTLKRNFPDLGEVKLDMFNEHEDKEVQATKALSYFLKYMRKSFKIKNFKGEVVEKKYQLILDGWKKDLKIKMFRTSSVDLPLYVYDKVYKNLPKIIKEGFLKSAKSKGSVLMSEIKDNIFIEIMTLIDDNKKTKKIGNEDSLIKVKVVKRKVERLKIYDIIDEETGERLIKEEIVYDYKIERLDVYIRGKKVFEKQNWEQISLSSFSEEEQYYILEEAKRRKLEKVA